MNETLYQRVRLWSGIFSIGANLGLIWGFYSASLGVSQTLLAQFGAGVLLFPVAAMLALGFVFDILVGFATETALGRTTQSFAGWARDWLLGALRVSVGLYVGLRFLGWMRFWPAPQFAVFLVGAGLFFTALALFIPALLPRSWRVDNDETRQYATIVRQELGEVGVPAHLPIVWIESEDETTVNGAIPPLGRAQIWLSSNVLQGLSPRQTALLIRRDWWFRRTHKHLLESAICVGWLLLGLLLARHFPPARDAVQAALGGAAVLTTWCFAALFVWPRLNSIWTRAGDRDLLSVAPREEVIALLRRVQSLNASDTQLTSAKAGVFHPIPDLERRLDNLSP